ncbi:septum formation initiator family protein [Magnetovibrio sp.]|uniref:FtsB family cell division protein n=1 Tax=Magnetovibrio sp. TaxID=2024836 RepID=UPI002F933718
MGIIRELKVRAGQIAGPVIGMTVVVYFAYHAVQGDRGLLALGKLRGEVNTLQAEVLDVRNERFELEKKVHMLRPETLDPDLLEERARDLLGFGKPDEWIVILHPDDPTLSALATFKQP